MAPLPKQEDGWLLPGIINSLIAITEYAVIQCTYTHSLVAMALPQAMASGAMLITKRTKTKGTTTYVLKIMEKQSNQTFANKDN